MRNIALAAIPSMYLIGAGSLALADDAMKNELGVMKDQTKVDVKAGHEKMKVDKDQMKADMKAKKRK